MFYLLVLVVWWFFWVWFVGFFEPVHPRAISEKFLLKAKLAPVLLSASAERGS